MKTTTAPSNPSDPFEALHAALVELDLTSLSRRLPELLDSAERDAPGYSGFLRRAAQIELDARLERKIARRVRWSRLGPLVTLDDFDFSCRPELSPHAVREFLSCRFVAEARNLLLVGRPSTGKTTVAKAIGHAACRQLYSVYYATMGEMLEGLFASRADHTFRKAFRRLVKPDLLVLDDAGFVNLDRDASTDLFRLVCARHRKHSTLVVSNLPFKAWAELLPSEPQAVAIVDRLIDQASILRFSGKSFRVPRDVQGAPLEGEREAPAAVPPVAASAAAPPAQEGATGHAPAPVEVSGTAPTGEDPETAPPDRPLAPTAVTPQGASSENDRKGDKAEQRGASGRKRSLPAPPPLQARAMSPRSSAASSTSPPKESAASETEASASGD